MNTSSPSNEKIKMDAFFAKSQAVIGAIAMIVLPYNLLANLGYAPKLDPFFTFLTSLFIAIKL